MVREKYLENEIFSWSGKVRELSGWPGKFRKDLESQGKVREFENKWLWQAAFRKFTYSFQEGKGCTFSKIVYAHLPSHWGVLWGVAPKIGKNLLPWGANSFL